MPLTLHESASESVWLDELRHIRYRPAMYIGAKGKIGLNHMFYMVLDEWLAQYAAGVRGCITVTLNPMNSVSVAFDGAKLAPTEITYFATTRSSTNRPNMTSIIRTAGVTAVNALSAYFEIQTQMGSEIWQQRFAYGFPISAVEQRKAAHKGTGVRVTFSPDRTIINAEFDYDMIAFRCRDAAYTLHGLSILLRDERKKNAPREEIFFADEGLALWPGHQMQQECALHPVVHATYEDETEYIMLELAFRFTDGDSVIERSFCNTVPTPEHGTHLDGLHAGILEFINQNAPQELKWRDISRGFTGVVSFFHPTPHYAGRSTVEITNPEAFDIAKKLAFDVLCRQFPDGAAFTNALVNRQRIDSEHTTQRTLSAGNVVVDRGA